jgi:hypothetical protein
MAKRQSKNAGNQPVILNQTISQSVNAWDSTAFSKLLSEQAKANDTAIKSLESAMASAGANQQQLQEQIAQSSMMKDIRDVLLQELNDKKIHAETEKLQKIQERKAQQLQNHLKREIELKQKAGQEAAELNKLRIQESKAIANLANNMETFKTIGDRMSDTSKKLKDNFGSMSALKTTALKAFNIGGIFNKSIAKEKFIQTQRKLGSEDDRSTLAGKFETANRAAKDIKKNEAEISQLKKDTGMSESELAKRGAGKDLFAKRNSLTETLAGADLRAGSLKSSPTQQFADSGANEEQALEAQKHAQKQEDLFIKIEQNTRGESPDQKAKPAEGGKEGGGIMSGLMGGGAGKALDGMKKFGIGLIAISAALWVAAKAFKEFGEVEWDSIGKGMVALGGLVLAAIGLDKVKGSIIKGAAVLGVLALAMYGMSAALGGFADLEWETIGKGMASVAGIAVIAAVMGSAIVPITLGAAAIGLLGGSLWIVGEAMQAVGKGFDEMTVGLEKLGQLDGNNLMMVGAGLAAIGAGMAVFGAGAAAAGIGNLVGGFLNLVTPGKSPVEQIMMMGERGQDIKAAGDGVMSLATGLGKFSTIDTKTIKAISDLPVDKIAAMGAAMRTANAVEGGSRANADNAAVSGGGGGGNTAVVNAPVTTNNNTSQIIRSPIRNQESSMSKFVASRYARA